MDERHHVSLTVNGQAVQVTTDPRRTLADVIRDDLGLTGTHLGCEHGVCGACTVLMDGEPVRSCLVYGVQAAGHEIETVESLAVDDELNPLQVAFDEHHGLQCGFCTPGFLMLITGMLREIPEPTNEEILEVAASNLCRCTGYQGILRAVRAVLDDPEPAST